MPFYFFDIGTTKKGFEVWKTQKIMDFETIRHFFRITDIKKNKNDISQVMF